MAIVGPTASGKTDVALAIARRFNGEILLADSRQVYRGMDIGTNKLVADKRGLDADQRGHENGQRKSALSQRKSAAFAEGIPYWGVDLVEPNEMFTVQEWKKYAQEKIEEIAARGHLPVIEGGTGLYVTTLLDNWTIPEVPPDMALRKKIEERIAREGLTVVAQEVLDKDPEAATFLQLDNPRRVIRALEVIRKTGSPFSQQRGKRPRPYNEIRIGIDRPLQELDRRIAERAKKQLDAGLESEVRALAEQFGWHVPAMSGIGYAEWRPYLKRSDLCGEVGPQREKVLERIIRHTKQYARAQRTWFRRDKNVHWVVNNDEAEQLAQQFLHPL